MQNKFFIAFVLAGAIFLTGGVAASQYLKGQPQAVGSPEVNVLSGLMTAASSTMATTSSTQVMATSTSRRYAIICNDTYGPVYLNFGSPAVVGKGIRLKQDGDCYEITATNLFTGAVNAIASTTAGNVSYIEVK